VEKLTECTNNKKLLQIYDEKKKNLKEELTTLRTQLEGATRNEEVMRNKQKEKKDFVEALENVVENLRRKLEEKD